jgi:hypothetical protein
MVDGALSVREVYCSSRQSRIVLCWIAAGDEEVGKLRKKKR